MELNKIEIDCEVRKCEVQTCRWGKHIETQKHKNNEKIETKDKEKLSKITDEDR